MSEPLLARLGRRPSAIWVEISPPRGIAYQSLLNRLAQLEGCADAIALTDNSMGKVRLSALVFGSLIKQRLKLPVALAVSCRDRNLLALKADLLGAAALGIDAVIALTGDRLPEGAHGGARTVRDVDAVGLLEVIAELNRGDTGEGKRLLQTLPNIRAGSVANPNRTAIDRELELLRRKAEAGARFVITQPIFEADRARGFLHEARKLGVHVLLGILPVKREAMAAYLRQNIRDLRDVAGHFDRFAGLSEEQARRLSIRTSIELMSELEGECAGFIIMSGGGPSLAIELAHEYAAARKARPG